MTKLQPKALLAATYCGLVTVAAMFFLFNFVGLPVWLAWTAKTLLVTFPPGFVSWATYPAFRE